jgi:hypothetical protein
LAIVRVREAAGETTYERVIPGIPDTAFRRGAFRGLHPGRRKVAHAAFGSLVDLDLAVQIIQAMSPKRP